MNGGRCPHPINGVSAAFRSIKLTLIIQELLRIDYVFSIIQNAKRFRQFLIPD